MKMKVITILSIFILIIMIFSTSYAANNQVVPVTAKPAVYVGPRENETESLKFIIFFVLALITYLIYIFSKRTEKGIKEIKEKQKTGKGKITRINYNDRGRPWFYVELEIDGKKYEAQTETYVSKPEETDKGDIVNIKYYFTKNGTPRCTIIDKGFESLVYSNDNDSNKVNKYILIASGIFTLLGAIGLIKYLL